MQRTMLCMCLTLLCAAAGPAHAAAADRNAAHVGLRTAAAFKAGSSGSLMMPRLRGGSNKIDIDDMCQIDPTRLAGVGIGFKKDKVGNHVVVSLAKGWPAALSSEIVEGDMLQEVDDVAVAQLSTTALVQMMRGFEAAPIKLLLQRGEAGDLVEVVLERVLQGVVDASDGAKKSDSWLESTIDMGLSMSGKATSMFSYGAKAKGADSPAQTPPAAGVQSGVAGVGIGFTCDEEANFVVSKLVAGGLLP